MTTASWRARYESLVERDTLRVLEASSLVRTLYTHPMVLELDGPGRVMHHTPDVLVEFEGGGALVEVKGKHFLSVPEHRDRLREVIRRLRVHGIKCVVVTEDDIRRDGLQQELAEFPRMRPLVGRYRDGLNSSAWDSSLRDVSDSVPMASCI
jgi:hypothetical protein